MGYIYIIRNDITDKVYIGQTKRTIEKRWEEHCKYALELDSKSKIYTAMKEIGLEHFNIAPIEEVEDVQERNKREIYWIAYYDSFENGYNSTRGGGCFDWSIASRLELYDKILELRKENKSYADIRTILHCGPGIITSALRYYGIIPQEKKSKTKEIYKINLKTGKIIAKYSSLVEAAKNSEVREFQISDAANGRAKTADGFAWCWAEDYSNFKLENHIDNKNKKVKCIEKNMCFDTIVEAASWLKENYNPKANKGNISKVCKGKRKTAYGFHWSYI